MQAKWGQLNPVVNSWLQTDFMFQDLNDQMQEIAKTMVSGLDFSQLGLTPQDDIQAYIDCSQDERVCCGLEAGRSDWGA